MSYLKLSVCILAIFVTGCMSSVREYPRPTNGPTANFSALGANVKVIKVYAYGQAKGCTSRYEMRNYSRFIPIPAGKEFAFSVIGELQNGSRCQITASFNSIKTLYYTVNVGANGNQCAAYAQVHSLGVGDGIAPVKLKGLEYIGSSKEDGKFCRE